MIILIAFLTFFGISLDSPGKDKKTLLLVFAHPDDELAIAPALSRLSIDYTIYTVYATDGKGGTRVSNIPPDSLGLIRIEEAKCSLAKLGLEPPIFLHVDRLDSKFSLTEFWKQASVAKDSLKNIIQRIRPNAIITAGPDGEMNLTVKFNEEDQQKSWVAIKCHQSQYTEREIEESIGIDKLDTVKASYFRRMVVDKAKRTDF